MLECTYQNNKSSYTHDSNRGASPSVPLRKSYTHDTTTVLSCLQVIYRWQLAKGTTCASPSHLHSSCSQRVRELLRNTTFGQMLTCETRVGREMGMGEVTRTGGADEGEEEVETEEREPGRGLGPGHEVEEAQVGEERDGEELRRHALGVHRRRPRVHGQQPAPHYRRSPWRPPRAAASAPDAIASAKGRRGEPPRPCARARRRAADGRQHLGVVGVDGLVSLGGSRCSLADDAPKWAGPQ